MYAESVMGFDGREMWMPNPDQKHLLRPDIEKVFTINQSRWLSIFISSRSEWMGRTRGVAPGYSLSIPKERESVAVGGLWGSLQDMLSFVETNSKEYQKKCSLIAITIVETPGYLDSSQDINGRALYLIQKPQPIMVNPLEPEPNWLRLGYDVQDAFFTEGLETGEYELELQNNLRERWGAQLNKYYLFDNQEQANLYSEWQEHAENHPYFVYGIYLVKEFP